MRIHSLAILALLTLVTPAFAAPQCSDPNILASVHALMATDWKRTLQPLEQIAGPLPNVESIETKPPRDISSDPSDDSARMCTAFLKVILPVTNPDTKKLVRMAFGTERGEMLMNGVEMEVDYAIEQTDGSFGVKLVTRDP